MTKVTRDTARALRRCQSPAEEELWQLLRARRLDGLKFVRQVPIGGFVVDFCCRSLRMVVELDGEIHRTEQQSAHDRIRDSFLVANGYTVLRFLNEAVFERPDEILQEVTRTAEGLAFPRPTLTPNPSPWEGEGNGSVSPSSPSMGEEGRGGEGRVGERPARGGEGP